MEIFYAWQTDGNTVYLDEGESAHCVRVLRHRSGDEISVVDGVLFDYVNQWCARHETIAPAQDFKLTDQDYNEFKEFVCNSDFKFESRPRTTTGSNGSSKRPPNWEST